jgi:hypothetical protein
MDEMREQKDWSVWNAVSQTSKSFWNGMLVGLLERRRRGRDRARTQRDAAIADEAEWAATSSRRHRRRGVRERPRRLLGLFEWSAPDGCAKDDVDGILQANPSIGYGR